MSCMFYNDSQAYQMAQIHQKALLKEFSQPAELRDGLQARQEGAQAQRRFFRLYRLRHWLYRLAPRMARAFL